jgi:hypothetical protein
VRIRPRAGKGHPGRGKHPGSIADIARGDRVFVLGRAAEKGGTVPTARIVFVER